MAQHTKQTGGCHKAIIRHLWPTTACSFYDEPVIIGSWNIMTFITFFFYEFGFTSCMHFDYSLPMFIVQRQKRLCHIMKRKNSSGLLVALDTVCVEMTPTSAVCVHFRSNEK